MAFLLSPKTGGGAASYALVTATATSINGAAAQEYTPEAPGTVHPGDVLSFDSANTYRGLYLTGMTDEAEAVRDVSVSSPYTVEAVAGAVRLLIMPNL
jgi:hypothetical protein